MPRKISSAIQSRNVSTQTPGIVRSRTRAKRVPECHDVPRTAAKQSVSRLPTPTVVRIQARYVAGENQTQIAKAEGCDRETVSRINAFTWCQNVGRIEDLRGRPDIPEPLFRGARDGVPNWVDRVGAIGNAVVPQIPELIARRIVELL